MNSENEFREILGDKLNGKQFNFDGASWEQARDLIDATREKKRRHPFIWIFFGLAVILSGIGAIFMLSGNEKDLAQHASNEPRMDRPATTIQNENNSDESSQKTKNNGAEKNVQPVKAAQKKESAETAGLSDAKKEQKTEKREKHNNASAAAKNKNESAGEKKNEIKKSHEVPAQIAIAVKPVKEKKEKANSENGGEAIAKSQKKEKDPGVPLVAVKEKKKNETENKDEAIKNKEQEEHANLPSVAAKPVKTKNEGTEKAEPVLDGSFSSSGKPDDHQDMKETAGGNIDTNKTRVTQEPVVNAGVKPSDKAEPEVSKEDTSKTEIKKQEAVVTKGKEKAEAKVDSASAENALVKKPRDPYHILSAEIGTIYFYGWQNPGVRDASGYNPYIGLNYSTHVHSKFWLRAGVGYYSVRNLSYSEKTSKTTHLGLGEESAVTVITPSMLQYATVNLKLIYDINKNNSVGFGYYYSYLLDVAVKKETYQYHSGAVSDNAVSKDHGYLQGFRKADNLLSVYYRRRIWKQLSANAEFMFGLNDTKDNAFFNSAVFERNFGFKCSLVYDIIRK
jgi:hypothetical protein